MSQEETHPTKNQVALADYVEDMHVVESHIEQALRRQKGMFGDQPNIRAAVAGFHDMAKTQRDALAEVLTELPREPVGNSVKDIGSTVLGKAAGLIDKVRSESNAKALRDDFTAFSLAAVSYGMLHTTAAALGNAQVAEVAAKHLHGYVEAGRQVTSLMPEAVVHDLAHIGLDVDSSVIEPSREAIEKAWQ